MKIAVNRRNKMVIFDRVFLTKNQVRSIWRFLKECARSKYANEQYMLSHTLTLSQTLTNLDIFFKNRMDNYTSRLNIQEVLKNIAKWYCFDTDRANFCLCTWKELVLRTFFVVPSIRIVSKKQPMFDYKGGRFIVDFRYFIEYRKPEPQFCTQIR